MGQRFSEANACKKLLERVRECKPGATASLLIGYCNVEEPEDLVQLRGVTERVARYVADNEESAVNPHSREASVLMRRKGGGLVDGFAYTAVVDKRRLG